jgi:hypothetical protein
MIDDAFDGFSKISKSNKFEGTIIKRPVTMFVRYKGMLAL